MAHGGTVSGLTNEFDSRSSLRVHSEYRRLAIYTLGEFRVMLPDRGNPKEAAWKRLQGRALLKFLLITPSYQCPTDLVIERLWPQVNLEQGREYLRRVVMHVRRTLEPDRPAYGASAYLVSDRESIGLRISKTDDESGIWFDAQHFEVLAEQALARYRRGEPMRDLGNAALDLYQGPFLPQDVYQDWLRPARQRYHLLWSTIAKRMAWVEVSDRQLDQAHLLLGKLVEAAPDDEDAVFRLMIVSAAGGMRVEALRLYEALRVELARTVASGPGPQLRSLRDAIRTGRSMDDWLARLAT